MKDIILLATEETILTLSAAEAVQIEFAQYAPDDIEGLGTKLGYERWHRANYYPEFIMLFDKKFRHHGDVYGHSNVQLHTYAYYAFRDKEAGYRVIIATSNFRANIRVDNWPDRLTRWGRRLEQGYIRLIRQIESYEPESVVYEYQVDGQMTEESRSTWLQRRRQVTNIWRRLERLDESSRTSLDRATRSRVAASSIWSFRPAYDPDVYNQIEDIWQRRQIHDSANVGHPPR